MKRIVWIDKTRPKPYRVYDGSEKREKKEGGRAEIPPCRGKSRWCGTGKKKSSSPTLAPLDKRKGGKFQKDRK